MDSNNKKNIEINDPYFEDVKTKTSFSFDFVLWIYRLLKYWYLFAVSIAICLTVANLRNRSWIPASTIQAMMVLEDRGNISPVQGAVPLGTILRNIVNQQIVLRSYGMIDKTVKNLPTKKMHVNYYRTTRFKRYSIYANTPVRVEIIDLYDESYIHVYSLEPVDDNNCRIFYENKEGKVVFSIVVPYDKVIENSKFKIKLEKTSSFTNNFLPFQFNFLTDSRLSGAYYGRITTQLIEDDGTALAITITGSDPAKDTDFLNAFLQESQNYNLSLKNLQADLTIEFIDKQTQIINDSLELSRIALEKFQRETGIYEIKSGTLRSQINKADEDRENLNLREKALLIVSQKITENILGNSDLIDPALFGLNETVLSDNVKAYNEALNRSKFIGIKNPLYEKAIDELNEYRSRILENLKLSQTALQETKEKLESRYEDLENMIMELPPQERELIKYQRDYKTNEIYQQFLSQRRYEAQIQRASNVPDNFVFENPRIINSVTNGGETGKRYLYMLILGLVVPLVVVILKEEVLNFTISTKEECERISGLPVIGTIENISKKIKNGVALVKNYPKSSFAESFRNLRVRIEYMAQKESKIAILVTSAEPADGKTFIAINIASIYQLMGKKVVILDLDLRRPSVSKTLRIDTHKGVSNYLIGQVTLDEIVITNSDYGFDIIPAGTLPPNPSELIKTAKTHELILHLKEIYDYVIVDCSPVGLVSDAYIIARMVDTSLFVVRRAKTNKSFFKSVVDQIKFDGIEHVALIFNDVQGREGYYGTSRYYGDKTYYLKKNTYYHDDYFEN